MTETRWQFARAQVYWHVMIWLHVHEKQLFVALAVVFLFVMFVVFGINLPLWQRWEWVW